MDYQYSEEQRLLQSTVRRLVDQRYSFQKRRSIVASQDGWSRDIWREFANLGLLGIPFEERHGGMGAGAIELMIVMEALGRGLVVEPFLETVVLAGGLLRHGGSEEQKRAIIPGIISGERIYALAFAEPQGRFNLANVTTAATRQGDRWRLDGHKGVVYGAPWADGIFLTARSAGGVRDSHGVTVFHVPSSARGVTLKPYQTIDGRRAAEVILDAVDVPGDAVIGPVHQGLALIERIVDEGIAAVCAEAAGAMEALNEKTLEYCKTRETFGKQLSQYQVLQHRLVDMHVSHAYAASTALMAALRRDAPPRERAKAASIAKYHACRDGRFVGQNAIQLHGGIGMTDEIDIGHYFKRLTAIDFLFGNADHHLRRHDELSRAPGVAA